MYCVIKLWLSNICKGFWFTCGAIADHPQLSQTLALAYRHWLWHLALFGCGIGCGIGFGVGFRFEFALGLGFAFPWIWHLDFTFVSALWSVFENAKSKSGCQTQSESKSQNRFNSFFLFFCFFWGVTFFRGTTTLVKPKQLLCLFHSISHVLSFRENQISEPIKFIACRALRVGLGDPQEVKFIIHSFYKVVFGGPYCRGVTPSLPLTHSN